MKKLCLWLFFIVLIPFILAVPPSVDISSDFLNVKTNEEYMFLVDIYDDDFDFLRMRLYENDNLIDTLTAESAECNVNGCLKDYIYSKQSGGSYTYKVEAEDISGNKSSDEITVSVTADLPVIQFFKIGNAQAGVNLDVYVELNDTLTFRVKTSASENLDYIDVGIDTLECPAYTLCEVSKDFVFTDLGEYTYSATAHTVNSLESEETAEIVVYVVCPAGNPCCDEGSHIWNAKPSNKKDACNAEGKFIEYTCLNGQVKQSFTGNDDDGDGVDQECGDCDDANRNINPFSNPYCDCNESVIVSQMTEETCNDNWDNDCDGRIDCFDEDCPSYDPLGCKLECSPGETKCPSGLCTNLFTDVNNCNSCGHVCEPFVNTVMRCDYGVCLMDHCAEGYANCDESLDDCEINIMDDRNNCGECGKICPSSDICIQGSCRKLDELNSSIDEECIHGKFIECVKADGCIGERECVHGSYQECVCEPSLDIISPSEASYDSNRILVQMQTNVIMERCLFQVNEGDWQVLLKNPFYYTFPKGKNTVDVKCSSAEKSFSFNVDSAISTGSIKYVEELLLPRFSELPDVPLEDYYNTADFLDYEISYSVRDRRTIITASAAPKKALGNTEIYLQIPECANAQVDDFTFYNNNFISLDDRNIFYMYPSLEKNLELEFEIDKALSESCISQFVLVGVVRGMEANRLGLIIFLSLIISAPIAALFYLAYKRMQKRRQHPQSRDQKNISSVIEMKRKEGEDDAMIKEEFEQEGIDDSMIDSEMRRP